jgi:hypothetical protein
VPTGADGAALVGGFTGAEEGAPEGAEGAALVGGDGAPLGLTWVWTRQQGTMTRRSGRRLTRRELERVREQQRRERRE